MLIDQKSFEKVYRTKNNYKSASQAIKEYNNTAQRLRIISGLKDISEEKWPDKTDIYCWWCCHPFDTRPVPLPTEYDSKRERWRFKGIFCSWECVKGYNGHECDTKYALRSELIFLMYKKIHGKGRTIKTAPPRETLKIFGGYLSISDFRKHTEICSCSIQNLNYGIAYPQFHELTNVTMPKIQKSTKLRLRRPIK